MHQDTSHAPIITEGRRLEMDRRAAERRHEKEYIAFLHHEQGRPQPSPIFVPLTDTNDNVPMITERKGGGGGMADAMPNISTPDIERGLRILCRTCVILFLVLVIATVIATILR